MICKCGYEGYAEIGDFGVEDLFFKKHFRCPRCKTTESRMITLDGPDGIKEAFLFPRKCGECRVNIIVRFIFGGADNSTVGYSIHCPSCQFGRGSSIKSKDYEHLLEWAKDKEIILTGVDCGEALKRLRDERRKKSRI